MKATLTPAQPPDVGCLVFWQERHPEAAGERKATLPQRANPGDSPPWNVAQWPTMSAEARLPGTKGRRYVTYRPLRGRRGGVGPGRSSDGGGWSCSRGSLRPAPGLTAPALR